jgi:glucarate dehydratase
MSKGKVLTFENQLQCPRITLPLMSRTTQLKITNLKLHSIAIADPPLRSSYGLHAPWALRTIVELETDSGLTGYAETYGGEAPKAALEATRPLLLGRDPFQLQQLQSGIGVHACRLTSRSSPSNFDSTQTWLVPGENPLDQNNRTFAALEIACLDIIGKAIGKPVCDLLGGRVRDRVPFSAYLFYKHAGAGGDATYADEYGEVLTPESAVRECRQMITQYGFQEIKLKAGVLPPEIEIATIQALRAEFGPTVPLRIDPNCAWSVDTSVHVGESLKHELANGGYLEDPCPALEGMSEVRRCLLAQGIDTPLASNVAVTSFQDIPKAKSLDAVQIVLSDPHYWGGLRQVQSLAHFCQMLGMGLSMHSNSHLGISLMAMTHVAAASPNLTYACDTHYPWQTEQDEIVTGGRIPFEKGAVLVPDKPGLGIEIDYDQLARGRERYRKIDLRKRDDEAEMRKHIDPNWKRVLPRW